MGGKIAMTQGEEPSKGDELRQRAAEAGRRAAQATSTEERLLLQEIQNRLNELAQIEDRLEQFGKK
jgi:hypothetical protein